MCTFRGSGFGLRRWVNKHGALASLASQLPHKLWELANDAIQAKRFPLLLLWELACQRLDSGNYGLAEPQGYFNAAIIASGLKSLSSVPFTSRIGIPRPPKAS